MDVRDYDLAAYRHQLGVVPQEAYLFPGTVRDAIAYGRPDATDAEVEAAARGVGAIDMIARLPGGFLHEVSERGRNLSAGQRQLIALARAYLVDPAILLLDEATAALDLAAEAAVNRATEQLAAQRTTLVVAHRLTTAARADRIVVMESRPDRRGRHPRRAAGRRAAATRRCGPRSSATPSWSPDCRGTGVRRPLTGPRMARHVARDQRERRGHQDQRAPRRTASPRRRSRRPAGRRSARRSASPSTEPSAS